MLHNLNHQQDQFIKLIGLSSFLEQQTNLDESLDEIATMTASILNIGKCSIMLFQEDEQGDGMSLRILAKHGNLPPKASTEAVKINNGIAGKVAASARPLLVLDIVKSEFFSLARNPDSANKSFICAPIVIADKVIGVLNVSNPVDDRCFDYNDLNMSVFVTLLIGRSVQVIQLQNLLKSKFAQIAIVKDTEAAMDSVLDTENYDADMLVKILSKSFYREMTKAGFTKNHIIQAATEIIAQLHESLARHDKRIKRGTEE